MRWCAEKVESREKGRDSIPILVCYEIHLCKVDVCYGRIGVWTHLYAVLKLPAKEHYSDKCHCYGYSSFLYYKWVPGLEGQC